MSRTTNFRGLEELRNEPVSLPFKQPIKATTLRKSHLKLLAVLWSMTLKTYVSVVFFL